MKGINVLVIAVAAGCLSVSAAGTHGQTVQTRTDTAAYGLTPEEYTGATFTITNLGSFGIEEFTAIINPPGSAILAVGAIRREPVVEANDQVGVRSNMKLTLSCDHRVIDGAVGARFLNDLKEIMEDPIKILY